MQDLFNLQSLLTQEEKQFQNTVAQFVEKKVSPLMANCYEKAVFPDDIIPELANLGLFGMTLPESAHGLGAGYVMYGLACQELEKGDSAVRSFVSVQSSLCMYPIYRYGTLQQQDKFLKKMSEAKLIGCFGLTEADAGSDPASMRTKAEKVEGGWILNGSKMWITNAPIAHLAIVWANTKEGIRGFIVEKEFKGYKTALIHHKMSLRASLTGEIHLDNCFVPDENYLPGSEKGLSAPLSCLSQARYGIAWGAMGAAQLCFDTALNYSQNRQQFNKPIASFQLIQKDLVDMANEIYKAQLYNLQAGRLREQDQHDPAMISMIKMNACRSALDVARKARNILGGNGISLEYPVIRHMMNLETLFTYEGTDNIHHLIVGKYLTGLQAFE